MKEYQKIRRIATEQLRKLPHRTTFLYCAPGPRKTLAGSEISAVRKANKPFIVKPIMRNGSNKSQTIGYSTSANSANGQHRKRRMTHKINVNICNLLLIFFPSYTQRYQLGYTSSKSYIPKNSFLLFFSIFHSKQFSIILSII